MNKILPGTIKLYIYILLIPLLACCGKKSSTVNIQRPAFSSDSAYHYIEEQMACGPRVPNSQGHTQCVIYLVQKLRSFGWDVTLQKGEKTDYAGHNQPVLNIIATFNPDTTRIQAQRAKVLLCAHYDTRPWCDAEEDYADRYYNVPGANDGASGVGVILEIARQLTLRYIADTTDIAAVEIVFFDVEDSGTPSFYTGMQRENTWCLGSQLYAEQANTADYQYGIVLDMVGAPDAVFPREYHSVEYAGNYVEQIWRKARELGYTRYFSNTYAYPITDDHYYINMTGIPCVDIIHYHANGNGGFASWWHTREDDMRNIDKATLQAVGEVVLSVL